MRLRFAELMFPVREWLAAEVVGWCVVVKTALVEWSSDLADLVQVGARVDPKPEPRGWWVLQGRFRAAKGGPYGSLR
jgi:hypothetical protein